MERTRHTPEQIVPIVRKLREADSTLREGKSAEDLCKQLEISEQTYHRWLSRYGGMHSDDMKRPRELEKESAHHDRRRLLLGALFLSCLSLLSFSSAERLRAQAPTGESPQPAQGADGFLPQHAADIQGAMAKLGSPLSANDSATIAGLSRNTTLPRAAIESTLQRTLDPYCIAVIEIAADRSVTVRATTPALTLQQSGWTSYLIKVKNDAAYTGRLKVRSPNAQRMFVETRGETTMKPEEMFTLEQLRERFLELVLYRNDPLSPTLSGSPFEYAILQIYSKRSGHLRAGIDFHIGDFYRGMRVVESSSLAPFDGPQGGSGLKGEYFNNTQFTGTPVLTRFDPEIDFNWGGRSPGAPLPAEEYSVRWAGQLIPPRTGRYRLGIRSNDGSRVYLDGALLVSNWGLHGTLLKTAEVELVEGRGYDLLVEYFQGGGVADVRLEWDDGPLNPTRIGFEIDASPAVPVVLRVQDDDGAAAMASFTITDGVDRYEVLPRDESAGYGQTLNFGYSDYDRKAQREYEYYLPRLRGIYPLPSKRLALTDPYADQYFHAQVYRADGEQVFLPPGTFHVAYTRGPEYLTRTRTIVIPESTKPVEFSFRLDRWIHLREYGYYSSDSHIHASGCCYYTNPEEGLDPEHLWRLQLGEDLNVANILNWAPNWYHQKSHFSGHDHPLSQKNHLMRYNVEVSGFPSSHAGHVVLLGLREDDYPGTALIEDWPTWNLPILRWAKGQNAVTGYAHSGWGLTPIEPTWDLPNYALPKMNDIGANEYIVTITEGVVDFYSVGDTPAPWELNMWYHSLNCGFRPRLSGETDFPCIYDERVGEARSYVKLDGPLDYDSYLDGIKRGCGYVSDGRTHIIEFTVNGLELGTGESELALEKPQTVKIAARVAALLPVERSELGDSIAASDLDRQPYWHIERARIGTTREIPVDLIVNGNAVDRSIVVADGAWKDLSFEHHVNESAWLALRVFPSAHTNPIFTIVGGRPIQNKRSAEWSRRAVERCWKMKEGNIGPAERSAAFEVFERARDVYDGMIGETEPRKQ